MPAGVYVIWCKKTKRAYVGESRDIYKRWSHHKTLLRQGLHPSRTMQVDWEHHGSIAFQFRVLELAETRQERERLEEEWILRLESHKSAKGYNKSQGGTSKGLKWSLEAKLHASKTAKERNADPEYKKMLSERCKKQHAEGTLNITAETRKKAGASLRGRPMSEEQKQKLRESALANPERMRKAGQASGAVRRLKG